ncbi:MAG: hypothetical protein KAX87_00255 [Nitrospira sp.]|nr:hypothetical protein [Nitrospira sp.]
MIDRTHTLPITRQAELIGISRGNVYYMPRAASEADQRLMKRIVVLRLGHPFAGARKLRDFLNRERRNQLRNLGGTHLSPCPDFRRHLSRPARLRTSSRAMWPIACRKTCSNRFSSRTRWAQAAP